MKKDCHFSIKLSWKKKIMSVVKVQSLTLEVNNPKKNKEVKETTWSDFESSKSQSEFG